MLLIAGVSMVATLSPWNCSETFVSCLKIIPTGDATDWRGELYALAKGIEESNRMLSTHHPALFLISSFSSSNSKFASCISTIYSYRSCMLYDQSVRQTKFYELQLLAVRPFFVPAFFTRARPTCQAGIWTIWEWRSSLVGPARSRTGTPRLDGGAPKAYGMEYLNASSCVTPFDCCVFPDLQPLSDSQ